ncbi:ras GEF [Scleroderma citrinum]
MASWSPPQPRTFPSPMRASVRGLPAVPLRKQQKEQNRLTDFWIPQVTQDGQIYFSNTLTGQHSRDLPKETEEDATDAALVSLSVSQSSVRYGTGAELGLVPNPVTLDAPVDTHTASHHSCVVAEPVHTNRMPISISQYPKNIQSATTLSTPPSIRPSTPQHTRVKTEVNICPSNRHSNRVPGVLFDTLTAQLRRRSCSSSSPPLRSSPRHNADRAPPSSTRSPKSHHTLNRKGSRLKEASTTCEEPECKESTLTQSSSGSISPDPAMQHPPPPSPPESVPDLLQRARDGISAVTLHLQRFGLPQSHDDEDIIDNLIGTAITFIRDLLYVTGPSFGHLSGRRGNMGDTIHAAQTHLIPAQRRAIATLSKFVLSARAVLNNAPWDRQDNSSHLSSDAEELERTVIEFVSIGQGLCEESHRDKGQRSLHGYFTAPHSGLGKAGAGAAGTWKGFGWVSLDGNEEAPRRSLDRVTFHAFMAHVIRVQEKLKRFAETLRASHPAEIVTDAGKAVVYELSSLLLFLGDIHIARHVDLRPVNEDKLPDGAQYSRTVDQAQILVRSFEATTQELYDNAATLLMTTQCVRRVELCESWRGRDESYDTLEALCSSTNFNLQLTRQNLESLLVIGQEQANILEQCDKSPIEWRMSQRSLVTAILESEVLDDMPNDRSLYHTAHISENVADTHTNQQGQPPLLLPLPNGKEIPGAREDPDTWLSEDDEDLGLVPVPPRPDKIRAFFGDEAPSHYLISHTADARPWYLRPNYDPAAVLIDPDGTVRGGTVPALVERLTAHEYADPNFSRAFLMTFRSFMTLEELLRLLVDRFWVQPPPDLDADELADWRKYKQYIVRMRVINTLKSMVQDNDVLEREELGILDRIAEFVSQHEVSVIPAAKQLLVSIKRVERGKDLRKITVNTSVDPPPAPIAPKRLELLEIDPLELARQLTITESHLYQKIRPAECMQRSKPSKQTKMDPRDGVANFIRRSNRIAQWVTYSILCKDDPRRRAAVMKQFILIADRCKMIQNFSTMGAIVSGLNSAPIHRLKRSWELVSSRYMSQLETCEGTINSYRNYNNFRSTLATVPPPCVPFVGVFLTALTHIQDGSKDHLPGNLVNFRKRQKTSEVIQDLQRWQAQPHNFHPLPSVLVFIDESLRQFGDQDVSDVFWQLSMEREPREREEEKLARILHESGFF